jgi:hypothetical protein
MVLGLASPALGSESLFRIDGRNDALIFEESGMPYWYQWIDPDAPDTNAIFDLVAMPILADSTVTFTAAQSAKLDFPRTLAVYVCDTDGGDDTDIDAGDIVVTGTNILGDAVTETFTITADTALQDADGTIAFKSITSAVLPVQSGDISGVKISIGIGSSLGVPFTTAHDCVLFATCEGAVEGTAPTQAFDFDEIEKNIISFNTAPNAAKAFNVLFWIPKYQDHDAATRW